MDRYPAMTRCHTCLCYLHKRFLSVGQVLFQPVKSIITVWPLRTDFAQLTELASGSCDLNRSLSLAAIHPILRAAALAPAEFRHFFFSELGRPALCKGL